MNSADNNSNAFDYCVKKAIPDGSNLYYATLFETKRNKQIIISLHAFLYELTDVIRECSDPGIARIKLHWWHEEIDRLFNQQARHPVTRQFTEHLSLDEKLKTSLNSIIKNFDEFVFVEQIDLLDHILALYEATAGEVWSQCGMQLGITSSTSLNSLRKAAAIYQYIHCLQEPSIYINETRCIIPKNIINQNELLNRQLEIKNNYSEQTEIFMPLINDLISRLENLDLGIQKDNKALFKHASILNRIALKTCDEIINDGCKLLNNNTNLTPLRKLWLAWWINFTT